MKIEFVQPKTFLVGMTQMLPDQLEEYLRYTGNESFLGEVEAARAEGLSDGEILCSFYAKLCYASLSLTKNKNLSKNRSIYENLIGTLNQKHGSVFEHFQLNFVTTDVSRLCCNELVRHRHAQYSQTSGRYVRSDSLRLVVPPELATEDHKEKIMRALEGVVGAYQELEESFKLDTSTDFGHKKRVTSALRRIFPNGQANEIGWSVNMRALRLILERRTDDAAEWEIRYVFNQVAEIIQNRFKVVLAGAKTEDGLYGMKQYKGLQV